jgi:hypothetical protein
VGGVGCPQPLGVEPAGGRPADLVASLGAEAGQQVGRRGRVEGARFGEDGPGAAVGAGAEQQGRDDQLAGVGRVEREGADRGRGQAAAVGVLDLGRLQQGGDRLGGPFDPAWAGADGDPGGGAGADQGGGRRAPDEAVRSGQVERVEPVGQGDDPADQPTRRLTRRGTGVEPLGPSGRLGPGVRR